MNKKLSRSHIALENEYLDQLPEFQMVLQYALQNNARFEEVPKEIFPWMRMSESFNWRAKDFLIAVEKGSKASPNELYHAVIHFAFAKCHHFKLKGRPLSILYGEAVSALAEFYFVAASMRERHVSEHEASYLKGMKMMIEYMSPDKKAGEKKFQRFVNDASSDPFKAYKTAVEEMYLFYKRAFDEAVLRTTGVSRNKMKLMKKLPKRYPESILSYNYGENVVYAMAIGGLKSSKEDLSFVEKMDKKMKASKSFEDFARALDIFKSQ